MKILIMTPQAEFNQNQQTQLAKIGTINYTKNRDEYPSEKLLKLCKGFQIIGADPDNLGGFERAKSQLTKIIDRLPSLKGIALASTSTEWIDLKLCRKKKIIVTNIPHYSTESVAEHTVGLLICLAKNIIINDRKFWSGKESKFGSGPGFELKGKTLGVIGLGSIGSRVAELAQAIGMRVIAYNRSLKKQKGVIMKSLNYVLSQSDALSIHLGCNKQTHHFISKKEITHMKKGVIIVNLIGPVPPEQEVVDKKAMSRALKMGKVAFYAYEGEDLTNNPLSKAENAIGLKGFAWYTKDALDRAKKIWVDNIVGLTKNKPINSISY